MVLIRLAKVAMIGSLAAYALIVTYDNIVRLPIKLRVREARTEHGHDIPWQHVDAARLQIVSLVIAR